MPKLNKRDDDAEQPEDLIQTFAACQNFPKDRAGVLALAQALARASSDFRIAMSDIVRYCADSSTWCPTPRDIRMVAIGIRDDRRNKARGNQQAEWERIYGPPEPDWPAKLIGVLVGTKHDDTLIAVHVRAIRDMLFYTEGDGTAMGDRAFWEGDHSNIGARKFDLAHYPNMINLIRHAGGWQTERELASDWIDASEDAIKAALKADRARRKVAA